MMPLSWSALITYSRMGLLPTGIMTFGRVAVNGLSLLPSPAARTMAFIAVILPYR